MIKVCGMREPNNIRAVEALGIDWIGLIFWSGSSRYVAEPPSYLPIKAKRVGVFVDASIDDILRHVIEYRLDVIQLHGHETPDYIQNLRAAFHAPHHDDCNCPTCKGLATMPLLIKALPIATNEDLCSANVYDGLVDYFLFDTKATISTASPAVYERLQERIQLYPNKEILIAKGKAPSNNEYVSSSSRLTLLT